MILFYVIDSGTHFIVYNCLINGLRCIAIFFEAKCSLMLLGIKRRKQIGCDTFTKKQCDSMANTLCSEIHFIWQGVKRL